MGEPEQSQSGERNLFHSLFALRVCMICSCRQEGGRAAALFHTFFSFITNGTLSLIYSSKYIKISQIKMA